MSPHRDAKHTVNIEEIDAQHAELFRRAGELIMGIRRGAEGLGRHIDFLHEYAVGHFGAEEEWMRQARYPGYVRHQAEHDRFVEDLVALSVEHARHGAAAFQTLHAERWLTEWLDQHVGGTDAEFARFVAGRAA